MMHYGAHDRDGAGEHYLDGAGDHDPTGSAFWPGEGKQAMIFAGCR